MENKSNCSHGAKILIAAVILVGFAAWTLKGFGPQLKVVIGYALLSVSGELMLLGGFDLAMHKTNIWGKIVENSVSLSLFLGCMFIANALLISSVIGATISYGAGF